MSESLKTTSRRHFLKTSVSGLTALTILPSSVVSGLGHPAPIDKLNIAAIGIGGVGFRNLSNLMDENIVALCDVDWDYGQKAFRRWSNAKQYRDFRVMLENQKDIDAVIIATPDHTHSVAAMAAMQLQKDVYVQAPMAHSIFEMRRMNETARVFNVVSQVGNQSASGDEVREICELIWAGTIGEISEVHAWTSHPQWPQGGFYPNKKMKEPKDLDWNLFLGPSAEMDYNSAYAPFTWRAWWNFGNGALASMGPHLLEPVFKALKLNAPVEVEGSSTSINLDSAPSAEKITFTFNRRDNLPKLAMPKVKLTWYDGGLLPDRPEQFPAQLLMGNTEGGVAFIGSEGMLVCDPQGMNYKVIKNGEVVEAKADKVMHRIAKPFEGGHERDWVRACKETVENRLMPAANFESQTALTETILVGTLAIRLQSLGKKLKWDSSQMKFMNIDPYEELVISKQGELYVENGIPKFDVQTAKFNAAHFVDQTVRPIYRKGWKQI
ncbi:MAG: Gfo/Idh/MocA family protein [Prolixibacteraceae bacterium]